ncbi:uncharacterized protein LOC144448701 isoform X1 [Glandiceps talaboti]
MENLDPTSSLASSQTSSQDPDYVPEETESPDRLGGYLRGVSRSSYTLRPDLTRDLTKHVDDSFTFKVGVCPVCEPILTQAAVGFFTIQHCCSTLKKRKKAHLEPLKTDNRQWRNIIEENKWIRGSLFDPAGNYLFCQECIVSVLGVSRQRLASQRNIKQQEFLNPVVSLKKKDVLLQKLEKYVLIPDPTVDWNDWWTGVCEEDEVEVRQFSARHGLEGRLSNNNKTVLKEQFLTFADANSYPTGRHEEHKGPLFYFLPVFTRLSIPRISENNYETKLKHSFIGVFNSNQQQLGRETVSSSAAEGWLSQYRSRHSIHPHKSDYCNTCKEVSKEICTKSTIVQRMTECGDTDEGELLRIKTTIDSLKLHIAEHKEKATIAQHFYKQSCNTAWQSQQMIEDLESKDVRTDEEEITLLEEKTNYVACFSIDYKMVVTVPQWHLTPQPAISYYKMKLCVDEAVIVHHNFGKAYSYIFDERCGPKNSNHTLSILDKHMRSLDLSWTTKAMVFMDNAPSTNKNTWLVCWIKEMMERHETLQYIRICFLLAGHSKFMPDWIFACMSSSMKKCDIFNTHDIETVASTYSEAKILSETDFADWRTSLRFHYGSLVVHGIGSYHDIMGERQDGAVVVLARENLDSGPWKNITPQMTIEGTAYPSENITPRALKPEKVKQLHEMYDRFIPDDKRLDFLPAPVHIYIIPPATETQQQQDPSAALGKQHMDALKMARRKK